jgi:hypothetical protein
MKTHFSIDREMDSLRLEQIIRELAMMSRFNERGFKEILHRMEKNKDQRPPLACGICSKEEDHRIICPKDHVLCSACMLAGYCRLCGPFPVNISNWEMKKAEDRAEQLAQILVHPPPSEDGLAEAKRFADELIARDHIPDFTITFR